MHSVDESDVVPLSGKILIAVVSFLMIVTLQELLHRISLNLYCCPQGCV